MNIHEYQAKAILKEYGILVPPGEVAQTPFEVEVAADSLGTPVVIKAQIHAGGRGKAGGVKVACCPLAAGQIARRMINKKLKTRQTASEGMLVRKVLVEKTLSIQKEFYLSIAISRSKGCPVIIASSAGGMEIEEIAETAPEKILEEAIDPLIGLQDYQLRKLAFGLELAPELVLQMIKVISALYRIFTEKDCAMAEINPLVLTGDNQLVALDAKMVFDDYALFRHPEIKELVDLSMVDPLEAEAAKFGANYVRLTGNIGCMVNGAGLAMATMDTMKQLGVEPANFLDISGSAKADEVEVAFRLLLSDPNVKVILINIFGGLVRPEFLAAGLTQAIAKVEMKVPLVIRLMGENVTEGIQKLREIGIQFYEANDMESGVKKAIELANGGVK